MNNWKDNLKKKWNENPLQVIMVASFAAVAGAKLIDSVTAAQSRTAYARNLNAKNGF